jgi:hypothetical protein
MARREITREFPYAMRAAVGLKGHGFSLTDCKPCQGSFGCTHPQGLLIRHGWKGWSVEYRWPRPLYTSSSANKLKVTLQDESCTFLLWTFHELKYNLIRERVEINRDADYYSRSCAGRRNHRVGLLP